MFPKYSRSAASSTSASTSPRTSALASDLAATGGSTRLVSASLSKRPTRFQAETSAPAMFAQVDRLVKIATIRWAAMSGAQKMVLKLDAFALMMVIVVATSHIAVKRILLMLLDTVLQTPLLHVLPWIPFQVREVDLICPVFCILAPAKYT